MDPSAAQVRGPGVSDWSVSMAVDGQDSTVYLTGPTPNLHEEGEENVPKYQANAGDSLLNVDEIFYSPDFSAAVFIESAVIVFIGKNIQI